MLLRLSFISLALFLIFTSAYSQGYVGIKGGFNLSELTGENEGPVSLDSRKTFSSALVIATKLRKLPIGFSIEPGYTLKGTKVSSDTLDYKFHYINLPAFVTLFPIKQVGISAGLELGYLFKAQNINEESKNNLKSTYDRRFELSYALGIGFSATYFMDIGFRYHQALTNVSDYDNTIQWGNLKNQYMQAYIIFKIAN